MAGLQEIAARLQSAPVATFHATLVRCVGLVPLTAHGAPDYLLTSGRANRFNPAGVACVYFSEDEKTARAEYKRRLGPAGRQPVGTFFAEARLNKVLDLANSRTCGALRLSARDLRLAWPLARTPTRTQLLGLALAQQTDISAVRFPSDAACADGFKGFNLVIFRDCIRAPDYVKILGPTKKPLDQWP
jgi:RES domain-containing protein